MKPKGEREECKDCIEQVHGMCLHYGWCYLKSKKKNLYALAKKDRKEQK